MCAAFVVFAMLRFSIALMMFGCGLVYLWVSRQDIGLIVDQTLNSSFQLNVLLAIPMFILAGNVMNAATISERIWAAADAVIGRLRAGLGHVTVLMNVVISQHVGQRGERRRRRRHGGDPDDAQGRQLSRPGSRSRSRRRRRASGRSSRPRSRW